MEIGSHYREKQVSAVSPRLYASRFDGAALVIGFGERLGRN